MASSLAFYIRADDPPAKREILRSAMKLFSQGGLAATSIRDIAKESGYTNPALYKHFASKEELALHLFETCHRRLWTRCSAAMGSAKNFEAKVDAYVSQWLELADAYPEVLAFLSDSARVLWPKASPKVRQQTMIGLAYTLVAAAPHKWRHAVAVNPHLAAASLQGTLAELIRMMQVGVVKGPATRWKADVAALFRKMIM
ncbi:MAG: TetR/AcrR family transcriptional regulator [Acidobacteriia bacterium]|nr:TetR/AcrR family transcriptional regulator [Terriglobia bacterium]